MSGSSTQIKRGKVLEEIIDKNGTRTKRWMNRDDGGASGRSKFIRPAVSVPRSSAVPTPYTGEPIRTVAGDRVEYRTPDGLLHRIGEPAVVYREKAGVEKVEYWENGSCVYRSMPGLIHKGTNFYTYAGPLCRLEGPAVQRPDGRQEYWLWGVKMKSYADLQRGVKLGKTEFLTRHGALAAPPPTLSAITNYIDSPMQDDDE